MVSADSIRRNERNMENGPSSHRHSAGILMFANPYLSEANEKGGKMLAPRIF
jgi:hypothetical protein